MILPVVVGTAQLVTELVSSAKNARDLAKDSSDHALKAALSDLYDSMIDVKARVVDLDEENRRLKAESQRGKEIVGPIDPHGYFFYRDKPDQPLCPKCLQSQPKNEVFLPASKEIDGGAYRFCMICHYEIWEKPRIYPSDPLYLGRRPIFRGR